MNSPTVIPLSPVPKIKFAPREVIFPFPKIEYMQFQKNFKWGIVRRIYPEQSVIREQSVVTDEHTRL